jgi:hypothetical protein
VPPAVFFDDEFLHEGYDRFRRRPRLEARAGPRPQPPPGWKMVMAIVWLLYLCSLGCPACRIGDLDGRDDYPGWFVLMIGWFPPYCVPWMANFLLVAGWQYYLQGRGDQAWQYGAWAMMTGCTTFALCHCAPVEKLLPGFYLWLTSLFAFAAAAYWLQQTQRARPLSSLHAGSEN